MVVKWVWSHSVFSILQHIVKDTVNDLLQYASEHAESCYRTCLAVYFKGKKLDNFIELGSVEGLEADSTIKLVEGGCGLCTLCVGVVIYS